MHKKTVFFFDNWYKLPASDPLRFGKNLIPSYRNDSNWSD